MVKGSRPPTRYILIYIVTPPQKDPTHSIETCRTTLDLGTFGRYYLGLLTLGLLVRASLQTPPRVKLLDQAILGPVDTTPATGAAAGK